jgi:hypothetical protein
MKIPAIESMGLEQLGQVAEQKSGVKFAELRAEMAAPKESANALLGVDSFAELRKVQEAVVEGKQFTPQQLLSFQLKANDAHMRVELLSKIAESAIATAKRLQNPQ